MQPTKELRSPQRPGRFGLYFLLEVRSSVERLKLAALRPMTERGARPRPTPACNWHNRPRAVIQLSPKRPLASYAPLLLKFSKIMPNIAAINPIALTELSDSPNQTKPITAVSTALLPAQAA